MVCISRGGAKGGRGAMAPHLRLTPLPLAPHLGSTENGQWGLNSHITIIATVFEELSPNRHI